MSSSSTRARPACRAGRCFTSRNPRWDAPPVRHGQGTNFSFADGHAEYWKSEAIGHRIHRRGQHPPGSAGRKQGYPTPATSRLGGLGYTPSTQWAARHILMDGAAIPDGAFRASFILRGSYLSVRHSLRQRGPAAQKAHTRLTAELRTAVPTVRRTPEGRPQPMCRLAPPPRGSTVPIECRLAERGRRRYSHRP